ncbi:MAG: bifunctional DNA-formamidopyrimidine glycosylase/DNA-(apurinic or apyrimidinic site) lyase [Patescibacteria group bacterium]
MPELPEVESLRRSLLPYVTGQTIKNVEVLLPKLVSSSGTARKSSKVKTQEFIEGLTDSKITNITRRAKNLIFHLDNNGLLLVHLKMTGQLVFQGDHDSSGKKPIWGGHPIKDSESKLPNKHSYVILKLDNGTLFYNDVRQFGYLLYYPSQVDMDKAEHFKTLGLEPLDEDFSLESFRTQLKLRTGVLKKVFLDQKAVVGLGNIYADEVCFEAGVRPMRTIKSLKKAEIESLYNAIKRILPLAVQLGGSSVANYLLADGSRGNYAHEHKVYGRGGEKCFVCGTILEKIQLAGRTTVYCKVCQK